MKKLLLMVGLMAQFGFGQENLTSYNSSYFSKKYDVMVSRPDDKGKFSYYVDCSTYDTGSRNINLIIKNEEVESFVSFLNDAKGLYLKWKQTAIENKVAELDKSVESKKVTLGVGFYYGSWHFDFSANITARFKIINGAYLMLIESDKLVASDNQYITNKGMVIAFSSEKEFDDFIKVFDKNLVDNFFNSKNSKESLFKE
jgi:hypothetical protein